MKYVAVSLLLIALSLPAMAQQPETLSGRGGTPGGKASVMINGQSSQIDTSTVNVQKKSISRPAVAQEKAAEPPKPKPQAVAAEKKPELTPEQKAKKEERAKIKAQDIDRLRTLQKQGAWFYTEDNKPLAASDLEKRLQSGDVANIKTVDFRLNEWKTKTEAEEPAPAQKK
jgi:hypothetical protein